MPMFQIKRRWEGSILFECECGAKTDFIAAVLRLPNELEALRATLIAGKINGSAYSGECACLAGTLAKQCGQHISKGGDMIIIDGAVVMTADASSPRERWFMAIAPGDTPANHQVAAVTLSWIDEAIAMRDAIRASAAGVAARGEK